MPYIEWSPRYATGIARIDADHENLFMIVNVLYDCRVKHGAEANLTPILTALGEYVKKHFITEEIAMQEAGYPGIDSHIEKHRAFTRRIQRYIEQSNAQPGKVDAEDLLRLLKHWLTDHVLRSDMDYVPYLKQKATQSG